MFAVFWRYKINKNHVEMFEHEYGSEGSWDNFFQNFDGYLGSFLYKSIEEADTYFLIDNWESQEAYDIFKSHNREYDELSSKFEFV